MTEKQLKKEVLAMQKEEITEHHIYNHLAKNEKDKEIKLILEEIASDELRHYDFFKQFTKQDQKPKMVLILWYRLLRFIFGVTFTAKILERGEEQAQIVYAGLEGKLDGIKEIINDEERHENQLLNSIEETRLNYIGSIVLGLNDALVELTGALAGLTFALNDARTVALAGLITGIAAAFSMASSEYLATKQESSQKEALISSAYTGVAYLVAVILLVTPYLIGIDVKLALLMTITVDIIIIFFFNFYISVAKNLHFKKRFFEMMAISLGVALVSFGISFIVKAALGV